MTQPDEARAREIAWEQITRRVWSEMSQTQRDAFMLHVRNVVFGRLVAAEIARMEARET